MLSKQIYVGFGFIIIILLSAITHKLGLAYYLSRIGSGSGSNKEGYRSLEYSTVPLLWNAGNDKHPKDNYASENILLNDSYPLQWKNQVNMTDQWKKWWHYPSFRAGSYKQITNNIRYPNNPDIATCTPGEFCGALYKNRQEKSNVYEEIPPVVVCTDKVRVNYYNADNNMLPYVSDLPNILY